MKLIFTALFTFLIITGANSQTHSVSANLNGANEVPPTGSNGSGTLTGTYDENTGSISISVTYANLAGNLTASHLHAGNVGVNGGVIVNLNPTTGSTSGSITGAFSVPEVNEASLLAGGVYINIHSTTFPGGDIRGQLKLIPLAQCEVDVAFGDLCIKDNARGVILKSPNGSCFRIQVADNGSLASTAIPCP